MSLIELITFIIAMGALFLLMGKRTREAQRQREEEEEESEEEIQPPPAQMKEILETLLPQKPVIKKKIVSTQKQQDSHDYVPSGLKKMEEGIGTSFKPLERREFVDVHVQKKKLINTQQQLKKQKIRIKNFLNSQEGTKDAIILREILGPPKWKQ